MIEKKKDAQTIKGMCLDDRFVLNISEGKLLTKTRTAESFMGAECIQNNHGEQIILVVTRPGL